MRLRWAGLSPWFWSLLLWGGLVHAAPRWEVAVIFLGGDEPDPAYQADIDRNIVELSQSYPNDLFRLSLYREFSTRGVAYYVDPTSSRVQAWDPLFFSPQIKGIPIAGEMAVEKVARVMLLQDNDRLSRFFKKAFLSEGSKRLLLIYGHGLAYEGLRGIRLRDLRGQLARFLPSRAGKSPLDILWLNSCFMASIEAAYELRDLSTFFIASEDAEFTAGAPFQTLKLFHEGDKSPEEASRELAESYLESYSFRRKGSQAQASLLSAATITVIETARLPLMVEALGYIVHSLKPLPDVDKQTLRRSSKRIELQMSKLSSVIDLGSFLRYVASRRDRFQSEEARARLDSLLHLIDLDQRSRVKTSPRLTLIPPRPSLRVVYGYNGWTKGDENDEETLVKLPRELAFDRFVAGPEDKRWPSRAIHKRLTVSPFAFGLDSFHFYFVEPESPYSTVLGQQSFIRTGYDYAILPASHAGNPIRFTGYTQPRGKESEKYTGLTVLDPTVEEVLPSYSYLQFSKATLWEELVN